MKKHRGEDDDDDEGAGEEAAEGHHAGYLLEHPERHDIPPRQKDVHTNWYDDEDWESDEDRIVDDEDAETLRKFFDFPTVEEVCQPWKDKLPFHAPRNELKKDTLSTSSREDDGGSIVDLRVGAEETKNYALTVHQWSLSAPVRKGVRDREALRSAREAESFASEADAADAPQRGSLRASSKEGAEKRRISLRFSSSEASLQVPTAPPEPDAADASTIAPSTTLRDEGTLRDDELEAEDGESGGDGDAEAASGSKQASDADAEDRVVVGTLDLAAVGGRRQANLGAQAGSEMLSTQFLSEEEPAEEEDHPPPSMMLVAQAVQRARETALYKQRMDRILERPSSVRARAIQAEKAEAAAARASVRQTRRQSLLQRVSVLAGVSELQQSPQSPGPVSAAMVVKTSGTELGDGGGFFGCGTSRGVCGA